MNIHSLIFSRIPKQNRNKVSRLAGMQYEQESMTFQIWFFSISGRLSLQNSDGVNFINEMVRERLIEIYKGVFMIIDCHYHLERRLLTDDELLNKMDENEVDKVALGTVNILIIVLWSVELCNSIPHGNHFFQLTVFSSFGLTP